MVEKLTRGGFDEPFEAAQVASPYRAEHRSGCERANRSAHPAREGELLRPREAGSTARPAAQREPAPAGHDAPVLDPHGSTGIPFGHRHAGGGSEGADARETVEARPYATTRRAHERDRDGIGHPVDVALDRLDHVPNVRGRR